MNKLIILVEILMCACLKSCKMREMPAKSRLRLIWASNIYWKLPNRIKTPTIIYTSYNSQQNHGLQMILNKACNYKKKTKTKSNKNQQTILLKLIELTKEEKSIWNKNTLYIYFLNGVLFMWFTVSLQLFKSQVQISSADQMSRNYYELRNIYVTVCLCALCMLCIV